MLKTYLAHLQVNHILKYHFMVCLFTKFSLIIQP